MNRRLFAVTVGAVAVAATTLGAPTATDSSPSELAFSGSQPAGLTSGSTTYKNCTALNAKYRHGVGRKGARDHVSGTSKPVTNFTVNTNLYNANTKSDRDKDGVACEKR